MLQEAGVVEKAPARGQYRRRRERRSMVGMLVHLDASTHQWIAGRPLPELVVALEDADGRIWYARCCAQEGTASTFAALASSVRRYGRCCELYPAAAAILALPSRPQRDRIVSRTAKAAKRLAPSASVKFWPARRRPAGAASAPLALSRGACRGN
jgi:hypothetical protein